MRISIVLLATGVAFSSPSPSCAAVLCAKAKRGEPVGPLRIRSQCKRRETQVDPSALGLLVAGPPGSPGTPGAPGAPGTPGADGQLRIYGDGSAGARVVASDETFDDANRQYTNFTVASGVTLTIPSGTVIRCTGTFTNDGTIVVATGSVGGAEAVRDATIDSTYQPPGEGVAPGAAARGELGPAGSFYFGGFGGTGLTAAQARSILQPGVRAGGGGSCGVFSGSKGGGGLTVLAAGAIVNNGTLRADGDGPGAFGSGGGAGGVVVLASRQRLENRGVIGADGGAGGPNGTSDGPGGGGGGGIVHMLAPVIDDTGSVSVQGGAAGNLSGTKATGLRAGGGAGGSCGGAGGSGGSVGSNDTALAAGSGGAGHFLKTLADPTALF
jgi:hypothetical protein